VHRLVVFLPEPAAGHTDMRFLQIADPMNYFFAEVVLWIRKGISDHTFFFFTGQG